MKADKSTSLLIVLSCYMIAIFVVVVIWDFLKDYNLIYRILIADVITTVIVFAGSIITKNSSMYDPYWSVAPPIIALVLITHYPEGNAERQGMILSATLIWGVRLTYNWVRGWKGLHHEDWRYKDIAGKTKKLYWPSSFFGIHLLPTLWVFGGCLPLFYIIPLEGKVTIWDYTGTFLCVIAAVIELISDEQLRAFKKVAPKNKFIDTGWWSLSRHPNYFGELLFWSGIFIMVFQIKDLSALWTGIGLVALIILFVFISIPMMEKRNLKNKPGYTDYIKRVSMLIPWPSSKSNR
ncbi:DUF1295 domain-containing protein [Marinigracilibium pacificum]|uniref:DUF1295 domain-containing protein n=1 Tax=Marinigracilibium pacificum TaxID=2729599 RepID=A0A848J4M0_9BACT|nr:DUF1295 domain-containing protein [Marinigracilibium pacificum]NMM49460.1 DUF1295 domain-containing protein [Marinigracilibium pacificum]